MKDSLKRPRRGNRKLASWKMFVKMHIFSLMDISISARSYGKVMVKSSMIRDGTKMIFACIQFYSIDSLMLRTPWVAMFESQIYGSLVQQWWKRVPWNTVSCFHQTGLLLKMHDASPYFKQTSVVVSLGYFHQKGLWNTPRGFIGLASKAWYLDLTFFQKGPRMNSLTI